MNKYQLGDIAWHITVDKNCNIILHKLLIIKIEYINCLETLIAKQSQARLIRYKAAIIKDDGEISLETLNITEEKLYTSKEEAIKTYENMIEQLK